jgi:predicted ATPase
VDGKEEGHDVSVKVEITNTELKFRWTKSSPGGTQESWQENSGALSNVLRRTYEEEVRSFRMFSFDPRKLSQTASVSRITEFEADGGNLAGILDFLRDIEPERWKALNDELGLWFPEFDQILFDRHESGKSIILRTREGKHKIKASDLSDGTLLSLAYLTVAYLPDPPQTVCFEEPERGIHPRLLVNIQEAMYRLAYPENFGDDRDPIQVIATSHSPYLLDLYKDHPEEIVISSKDENGVHFEKLVDKPHINKILQGEALGEVWFTGILGGVPANL